MKKFIKYLLFGMLIVAIGASFGSCQAIEDLETKTAALEEKIKGLDDATAQLATLKTQVEKAQADATQGINAANEAQKAADKAVADAKAAAIAAAEEAIAELKAEIGDLDADAINEKFTQIGSDITALGGRVTALESDSKLTMLATLQLYSQTLRIFNADQESQDYINGLITDLTAGTIKVSDIKLADINEKLSAIESVSFTGISSVYTVVGVDLVYSDIDFLLNVLVEENYESVIDQYVAAFTVNRAALTTKFPYAYNETGFKFDYTGAKENPGNKRFVYAPAALEAQLNFTKGIAGIAGNKATIIVKVNPVNANITASDFQFIRVDGDKKMSDFLTVTDATPYKPTLQTKATGYENGLWALTVEMIPGINVDDFKAYTTEWHTYAPVPPSAPFGEWLNDTRIENFVNANAAELADIPDYILEGIQLKKIPFAVAYGNTGDDSSSPVSSKYDLRFYDFDIPAVYNSHVVDASGTDVRKDDFLFTVNRAANTGTAENPIYTTPLKKGTPVNNIRNRFTEAEDGTLTSNFTELRWIDKQATTNANGNLVNGWTFRPTGGAYTTQVTELDDNDVDNTLGLDWWESTQVVDIYPATTSTDDRNNEAIFRVKEGEPFFVSMGVDNNTYVDLYAEYSALYGKIAAFYVTLDAYDNAVESAPSEWNAWNAYAYTGLYTVVPATAGTTGATYLPITIKQGTAAESPVNDIIGFRVHAVNYDGTLVDPDGKAFYVVVTDDASTSDAYKFQVRWPNPYAATVADRFVPADGVLGTTVLPLNVNASMKQRIATARQTEITTAGANAGKPVADGGAGYMTLDLKYATVGGTVNTVSVDDILTLKIAGTGVTPDVVYNGVNYIYSTDAVAGTDLTHIAFRNINPRGIKDNDLIEGTLSFYEQRTVGGIPTMVQFLALNLKVEKLMPGFPYDVDYKNEALRDGKLWTYPTRQWEQYGVTPANYVDTPDFNAVSTATGAVAQDWAAGNYNYNSAMWFGSNNYPLYYGVDDMDNYYGGFRFFGIKNTKNAFTYPNYTRAIPTWNTGQAGPWPFYGDNGLNGFINHDSRINAEEVGLIDPNDTGYTRTNKEVGGLYDLLTPATDYTWTVSPFRTGRTMHDYEAQLTWGWGYIHYEATTGGFATGTANNLYWADNAVSYGDYGTYTEPNQQVVLGEYLREYKATGSIIKLSTYPIVHNYRSFIQDLNLSWTKEPELIYNAEETEWYSTVYGDIIAQSATGTPFSLAVAADADDYATYTSGVPRNYKIVKISIWTIEPSTTEYTRENEYFEPTPTDAVAPSANGTILWKAIEQQNAPSTNVTGRLSIDIEDEFGHVYRVYFRNTDGSYKMVTMKPRA